MTVVLQLTYYDRVNATYRIVTLLLCT